MSFPPRKLVVRLAGRSQTDAASRSPGFWIVLAALIGGFSSAITAISGHYSKSREIEIAKLDQAFKTRTGFLDRAIDPQRSREDRKEVLRFLVATEPDGPTKTWAVAELQTVQNELDALKQANSDLQKKLDQANHDRVTADKRFSDAQKALAAKGNTAAENFKLRQEVRTARTEASAALTEEKEAYTKLLALMEKDAPAPKGLTSLSIAPTSFLVTPTALDTSGLTVGGTAGLSFVDSRSVAGTADRLAYPTVGDPYSQFPFNVTSKSPPSQWTIKSLPLQGIAPITTP